MIMIDAYVLGVFLLVGVLAVGFLKLRRRHHEESAIEQESRVRLRARREAEAEYAMATEKAMNDLKTSVEGLATCMANLDLRMRTVDQRQRKLDEQSAQLMRRRGFDEAVSQVRDGKPTSDIARQCGMPVAEVELLKRIQSKVLQH